MKILHIVEHLGSGGGVISPWHLATAAALDGSEEHEFLCLGQMSRALVESTPRIKVHQKAHRSFEELGRWVLRGGFDVLHWHWWERMPFLTHMTAHPGPAVVITCDVFPSCADYRLTNRDIEYADLIVFDGLDAMKAYPEIAPAKRMWIVGSARLDEYAALYPRRERHGLKFGRGSILTRRKCPVDLIAYLRPVLEAVPDSEFLIFGEGPLRHKLARDIRRNQLQRRVLMPGWVEDFPRRLSEIDIYLYHLPPDSFASSELNLQGAAAAGLPIILMPSDGTRWMFQDGVDAMIANTPDDAVRIAQRLANDPAERRRLGEAARQKALKEWGVPNMVEQYRSLVYCSFGASARVDRRPWRVVPTPPTVRAQVASARVARLTRRVRRRILDLVA